MKKGKVERMFGLGFFELVFLLGMALVLLGPKEFPRIFRKFLSFLNDMKALQAEAKSELIDFEKPDKK